MLHILLNGKMRKDRIGGNIYMESLACTSHTQYNITHPQLMCRTQQLVVSGFLTVLSLNLPWSSGVTWTVSATLCVSLTPPCIKRVWSQTELSWMLKVSSLFSYSPWEVLFPLWRTCQRRFCA